MGAVAGGIAGAAIVCVIGFMVGIPWLGPIILSIAGAVLVLGKK